MVGRSKFFLVLLPILILPLLGAATPQQQDTVRFFPETGHTVKGEFLDFFSTRGGLAIYGYPITDEFRDPNTGMTVQYFQRARMELHPENPAPYRVQLGLLADEMGMRRFSGADSVALTPDCQFFPETGFPVCYAFLDFFHENGGLDIFGYPIGGFDVKEGFTIQYFQRARMEWHPEKPQGHRVQLANLGSIYFDVKGLNPDLLSPQVPSSAGLDPAAVLTALNLRASVYVPVAQPRGSQVAYLLVRDQYGQPVVGATGNLVIRYSNATRTYAMPSTDAKGTSQVNFVIDGGRPGEYVRIDFTAIAGRLTRTTSTAFLLWW